MSPTGTSPVEPSAADSDDETPQDPFAPHDEGLTTLRDGISSSSPWTSPYGSSDGGDPSWTVVGFSD